MWHRILGWCLRETGHLEVAFPYLEKAVTLDPDFYLARGSLAEWYRVSGKVDMAIELERLAITLISTKLGELESTVDKDWIMEQNIASECTSLREKLVNCYGFVARLHKDQKRFQEAHETYEEAALVRGFPADMMISHFNLLATSARPTRFSSALSLLHEDQDITSCNHYNDLIGFLTSGMWWPDHEEGSWFWFMCQAAEEQGELNWLVEAYETAREKARLESLRIVAGVNVALLVLYRDYFVDEEKKNRVEKELMGVDLVAVRKKWV